jgi:hypothetical protein
VYKRKYKNIKILNIIKNIILKNLIICKMNKSDEIKEYKSVHCTNTTRKIDDLMKYYNDVEDKIYNSLNDSPKELSQVLWSKYLNIDTTCRCSMGTSEPDCIIKSNYKCMQCTNLSRVAILSNELINTPFKLCAGAVCGNFWVVQKFEHIHPIVSLQDGYKYSAEYITNYYNKLNVCDSTSNLGKYLTSDSLTHSYLIGVVLKKLSKNIVNVRSAFVCNADGYLLSDNNPGMSEFSLSVSNKDDFVFGCLHQLVHTFGNLFNYNFTHNNVSTHSLQFSNESYNIGKKMYNFTLKIGDFQNACIDSQKCRLFNYNSYSEMHISDLPIISTTEVKLVDLTNNGSFSVYKFDHETGKKIMHLRRLGVNLYSSSLDLYCYLVVLGSNSSFFNTMISNESLYKLWTSCWNVGELEVIHSRINKLGGKNIDVWDCMTVLSGLSLRCDLYPHLSKKLN